MSERDLNTRRVALGAWCVRRPGPMPSTYDPAEALPLRVPRDLRAELDTLVATLPRSVALPRNSVAVAALRRGLEALRVELGADPLAVHRALAKGESATVRGDGGASAPGSAPAASKTAAKPRPARARPPKTAHQPAEAPAPADTPDAATVRELLTTVLQLGAATQPGGRGWTVKALARAVGCDRRALQVFRDRGDGMGPALRAKLWTVLRGDAPVKG